MTPSAKDMAPEALEALMLFYRDAGVDCVLEDDAIDRFAETVEAQKRAAEQRDSRRQQADADMLARSARSWLEIRPSSCSALRICRAAGCVSVSLATQDDPFL